MINFNIILEGLHKIMKLLMQNWANVLQSWITCRQKSSTWLRRLKGQKRPQHWNKLTF